MHLIGEDLVKQARKLQLKREALDELTADQLVGVVGGDLSGATCPVRDCVRTLDNTDCICYTYTNTCTGCVTNPCN
jgi:hypothetical protein